MTSVTVAGYVLLGITGLMGLLLLVLIVLLVRAARASRASRDSQAEATMMAVALQEAVTRLKAQERAMGRRFTIRIGANESVFGPSPKAVAAMAAAAADCWKYGDPEIFELKRAIAAHHGLLPANVSVGEGIDGLLGNLVRLLVAPGNPLGLGSVADLARPGLRVAGRQNRAGSHVLLVHLLNEAGLRLDAIAFLPEPAMAEDEVAAAVAEGRAGVGFGIRAEAEARGLGFVPLVRERFDLVMPRRAYFEPPLQVLMAFARGGAFAARAARMGGYDVAETGRVAFNG